VKIVVTSDLHLDWVTAGVSRFDEVAEGVDFSVEYALELKRAGERVFYVCCGDVCDPDSGPVVLRCVGKVAEAAVRLRQAGVSSLWVAGNHDAVLDGRGNTTLHPLAAASRALGDDRSGDLGRIWVAEKPTAFPLGDHDVLALPYPGANQYDPATVLSDVSKRRRAPLLVFSHLVVPGLIQGEEAHEMARGRDVFFPIDAMREAKPALVVNGHHHARQVTPDGIHIPGSAARLRFGPEEGNPDPAFLVLSVG
jgi:DNA repair exonuclease SbcCD nuclease subunit